MQETLERLNEKAKAQISSPDDYIGEDGLVYCAHCNTPKQTNLKIFGRYEIVNHSCECEFAADEEKKRKEAETQRAERIATLRISCFADKALKNCTFDKDNGKNDKMQIVRKYANNFEKFAEQGQGLLIYGGVGSGKTFAASCVANAVIDKGQSALVSNFIRLINQSNEAWERRQAVVDGLQNYKLLVLDDLGVERQSEYMREQMFNIIDTRYRSNLPLIITTNLPIEQIKNTDDIWLKRIYDRILAMCIPIDFGNTNRRQEEAQKRKELLRLLTD